MAIIIIAALSPRKVPSPEPFRNTERANGISRVCRQKPESVRQPIQSPRDRYDAVPSFDGSRTARVRFLTLSTKINRLLFDFLASARLAGVPLSVLGRGWDSFNMTSRIWLSVKYADAEHLNDEDVVLLIDSDVLFTGEDLYPVVQEFVSNSPATAGEADPLLVRLNEQTAPVLFSVERVCVKHQIHCGKACRDTFDEVEYLHGNWSLTSTLKRKFVSNVDGRRNPYRFINGGFMIARVWALRRLNRAFYRFMAENPPAWGGTWSVDQGILSELFVALSKWEVTSGLLSAEDRLGKEGPLGMIGGMISLDYQHKFSSAFQAPNYDFIQYGFKTIRTPDEDRAATLMRLHQTATDDLRNGTLKYGTTCAGAAVAKASLTLPPFDTAETTLTGSEYWGVPVLDNTEPRLWHFCGPEKYDNMNAYAQLLPTLVTQDAFPWEEEVSSRVFWAADPTPVWSVIPSNDHEFPVTLIRNDTADFTNDELCQFATSERYFIQGSHGQRVKPCLSWE